MGRRADRLGPALAAGRSGLTRVAWEQQIPGVELQASNKYERLSRKVT
jgi:hypothetical protein